MADVTIKVCFLGELRSIAGRRGMDVTLAEGSTVETLVKHLCETLGETFTKQIYDQYGNLFRHVSIFTDGKSIDKADGLQTQLKSGDVDVLILPIFEGG